MTRWLETHARGPGQESRLVTTYFDTPNGALARRGLTLRVREQAGHFVQTVKSTTGDGDATGGASLARGEWEDKVAGASPDPHAAQTGHFIPADAADALCAPVRTDIARHTLMLCPNPQTRIEAAVDRGQIASARGNSSELVCENRTRIENRRYSRTLRHRARPARRRTGAARTPQQVGAGVSLSALPTEPERVTAVQASEVAIDPAVTAGAALRRSTRSCVDQIVGN